MAEIPGRDALEATLTRKLSTGLRKQYKLLMDKLGDPPVFENLSSDDLKEFDAILTRLLGSVTQDLYVDQAEAMLEATPGITGVDWSSINSAAANWSKQYVFDLVRSINDNSKKVLQQAIGNYYEQSWTREQLEKALIREFGARRASTIAVTEVTRACTEGERAVVEELNQSGVQLKPFWQTNNDEIVRECEICFPRHKKEIKDNFFPPAHPNCRCWVNWLLAEQNSLDGQPQGLSLLTTAEVVG